MKTNFRILCGIALLFVTGITTFVACNKDVNNPPTNTNSTPSTTYNMYMTDAPSAAYQQVNVNIVGAQVNSGAMGWVSLNIHPGIYNLLTLTNGNTVLIASGAVPVGVSSQVRLMLGQSDNTVMVNNRVYPLQLTSEAQTGIKVNVNATLTVGVTYNVTLDFDAAMSVVADGSGGYILKPVVRGVVTPFNGSIKGTINPINAVAVLAINGIDTSASISSNASGNFEVQGLASGTYNVVIVPQSPYSVETFTNIQVTSGNATEMGIIMLH